MRPALMDRDRPLGSGSYRRLGSALPASCRPSVDGVAQNTLQIGWAEGLQRPSTIFKCRAGHAAPDASIPMASGESDGLGKVRPKGMIFKLNRTGHFTPTAAGSACERPPEFPRAAFLVRCLAILRGDRRVGAGDRILKSDHDSGRLMGEAGPQ